MDQRRVLGGGAVRCLGSAVVPILALGAAHAAGGAASAAAVASAFVLFAPFHNGYDGEDGRRKDDRRKYEGDGEPRARQLGGLKLCAQKKLLHCAFLKR